jgi:hypothetical protein
VIVPADSVEGVEAAIEVNKICASSDEDVLAVIDHLTGAGVFVGGGAPTNVRTTLEKSNVVAAVSKGAGSGEAGKSATDDGDSAGRLVDHFPTPDLRGTMRLKKTCRRPRVRMKSFLDVGMEILIAKTL